MANRFLNNISINDQYTLPASDGSANQVLATNGSGQLSFVDQTGGTSETAERIEVTVKNVSGGSLSKGTVVHASPSATPPSGNVIEVIAADYDDSTKMPAIGILNETIADTAEGSAVMMGAVSGIDTSSFSIGDELYVGNLGALTNTKPTTAGQLIQKIAVVVKSHASNGLIKIFGAGRSNDVPLPLYIDNTNQRVGIGESSPATTLHVNGRAVIGENNTIGSSYVTHTNIIGRNNNTANTGVTTGTSVILGDGDGGRYGNVVISERTLKLGTDDNVANSSSNSTAIIDINNNWRAGSAYSNIRGFLGYFTPPTTSNDIYWFYANDNNSLTDSSFGAGNAPEAAIMQISFSPNFGTNSAGNSSNTTSMYFAGNASSSGAVYITASNQNTSSRGVVTIDGRYQNQNYEIPDGQKIFEVTSGWGRTKFVVESGGQNNEASIGIQKDIFHLGDTDTFFGFTGADTFAVTTGGTERLSIGNSGATFSGSVTGSSFVKSGGTSSQFLKADGSVDSSTYLTAHPNISAASSSDNSGNTFIQDITLDSNGHITGLGTGSVSGFASTSHNHAASDITSGTLDIARLPEFIEEKYIYTSNDSNAVYMPMVKGGMYGTSSSSVTGQILIKIPSYKTNMMMQFYVDIYEYETGETMTFKISGYNNNDTNATWYNTSVVNLSDDTDRDFTVRFGADTSLPPFQYVTIGETNSTWAYPQINIRDFYGGYATSEGDTQGSFDVSFVTTTPGSVSRTHTGNFVAGDYNNLKNTPSTFTPSAHNQAWSTITSTPTTLAGYGITDAAAAGDENIIDGATSIWNADGDGDVFVYDDNNPTHNGKNVGAVIDIKGDGVELSSLIRAGIYTGDHVSVSRGYYVGTVLDTTNTNTTQVINSSGYWSSYPVFPYDSFSKTDISTRTETGFYQDSSPTSGEGWPALGGNTSWAHLISCTHSNDSNYYAMQLSASFYNQNLYYRSTAGSGTTGWSKMWSDQNDGAGSGLDADLLDGQQGAAYFRNNYTSGGDLNTDSASGIYRFQTTESNRPGGITYGTLVTFNNNSDTGFQLVGDYHNTGLYWRGGNSSTFGGGGTNTSWFKIWHDGNDGSGSGLDADLLDGAQGSSYLRSDTSDTFNAGNGGLFTVEGVFKVANPSATSQAMTISNASSGGDTYIANGNGNTIFFGVPTLNTTNIEVQGVAMAEAYRGRFNTSYYTDHEDTGDSIRVAGDIVAFYSSDKRYKENIKPIESPIEKVKAISGVTFEWNEKSHKETGKKDIGVIAQEVEEVLPEIVQTRDNGYKAVDYQKLTAVLIEAVKDQQKQIDELKSIINGSS